MSTRRAVRSATNGARSAAANECAAALGAGGSDTSQDPTTTVPQPDQPPQSPGGWRIEGGFYLWLPWIDGEVSVAGITANIDLSFSECAERAENLR